MKIALAQINPTVGDLQGNVLLMEQFAAQAQQAGAQMVIFPEMSLCGYPPEDLLLRPQFLADTQQYLEALARASGSGIFVVGFAQQQDGRVFNSLAVMQDGKVAGIYQKAVLPNYGVFDEKRYFTEGAAPLIVEISGLQFCFTICEDIWDLSALDKRLSQAGQFDILVNISASPFHAGKIHLRQDIVSKTAVHFGCPVLYCNLVGGQDELVFDGQSLVVDAQGRVSARAAAFEQALLLLDINKQADKWTIKPVIANDKKPADAVEEIYQALVLGTRDYVRKNGFKKAMIGLSGGIDSALTAAIAVDALGADNVVGITMPSRFNLTETQSDAQVLAQNLTMEFHSLPIEPVLGQFSRVLSAVAGWNEKGLAYENLQARVRGCMMMSLSNQLGYLVLTTGNKSETAVGYCTLYGDTAGGFAVIKDVPKIIVYKLCDYVNRIAGTDRIPQSIIDRVPTAELRHNQKDSDSLPEYNILDGIIQEYIENDRSPAQIIADGFAPQLVEKTARLIDKSEYKRRQCPPGVKITPKAFGKDRRMPITNKYLP